MTAAATHRQNVFEVPVRLVKSETVVALVAGINVLIRLCLRGAVWRNKPLDALTGRDTGHAVRNTSDLGGSVPAVTGRGRNRGAGLPSQEGSEPSRQITNTSCRRTKLRMRRKRDATGKRGKRARMHRETVRTPGGQSAPLEVQAHALPMSPNGDPTNSV